jgi:hypothetical protein
MYSPVSIHFKTEIAKPKRVEWAEGFVSQLEKKAEKKCLNFEHDTWTHSLNSRPFL